MYLTQMNIGCLILNYYDYQETIGCVNNLEQIDVDMVFRIVIVDNHSPNDSYEILKKQFSKNKNVIVIQANVNEGYAKGNNIGFRFFAKYFPEIKYVILMNPDTRLIRYSTVYDLAKVLTQNKDIALVAPVAILNGVVDYVSSAWNTPTLKDLVRNHCKFVKYKSKQFINASSKGLIRVDAVQGAFYMVRMDALKKVNYLDEGTFMYCEEVLLSRDLRKAGYREAVLCDDFFEHNHKSRTSIITLKKRLVSEKNFYKSRLVYCKKHLGRGSSFALTFVHYLNNVYILVTHPIVKIMMIKHPLKSTETL